MRIRYLNKRFHSGSTALIEQADAICREYQQQGFDLTLRQLYYQFVARGFIPNKQSEYKRLGSVINDARLAGYIDWNHIVDRTRYMRSVPHWDSPSDIINSVARQFRTDKWESQSLRIEVWIEKDALVGVIEPVCRELDIPFFACRGYVSQSELWAASRRHLGHLASGQRVLILHLGDHDPSGIDMTRDNEDRLRMFIEQDWLRTHMDVRQSSRRSIWEAIQEHIGHTGPPMSSLEMRRVALNMNQVRQYDPPPNPAKLTDSRAVGYIAEHGNESWELDALSPPVLDSLIRDNVMSERSEDTWAEEVEREREHRRKLAVVSERWDGLTSGL